MANWDSTEEVYSVGRFRFTHYTFNVKSASIINFNGSFASEINSMRFLWRPFANVTDNKSYVFFMDSCTP